jgi:hypothetical protein
MPELLREEPLTSSDKGSAGQDYVSSMAKLRGIRVARPEPDNGTDLLMWLDDKFIRVQVKTRYDRESLTFSLAQSSGKGYGEFVDCVIGVDLTPISRNCLPKLFMIPSCDLSDGQKATAWTSIKEYEDRWDLLFCDKSVRDKQKVGLVRQVLMSAVNEFSARGFAVSHDAVGSPRLLIVTKTSGEKVTVSVCKAVKVNVGRRALYEITAPKDFESDWMVGHDPDSNVFVFIPRDEILSLAVVRGRRKAKRVCGSPCINAWHLLEGSGTDAPRTNNN